MLPVKEHFSISLLSLGSLYTDSRFSCFCDAATLLEPELSNGVPRRRR